MSIYIKQERTQFYPCHMCYKNCLFVSYKYRECGTIYRCCVLSYRWLTAYSAALSFRTSHYFVCYLSEVTATAVGIGYENRVDGSQDWYENSNKHSYNYVFLCLLVYRHFYSAIQNCSKQLCVFK